MEKRARGLSMPSLMVMFLVASFSSPHPLGADASDAYKVSGGVECPTYQAVDADDGSMLEQKCRAHCSADPQCGGFLWDPALQPSVCHLTGHEQIASTCVFTNETKRLIAVREIRTATFSLFKLGYSKMVHLRCPFLTRVSNISKAIAGAHPHVRHSHALFTLASMACLGQASCRLDLRTPGFLDAFFDECGDASWESEDCDTLHVELECYPHTTFNNDRYFTQWSQGNWPQARRESDAQQQAWQQFLDTVPAYPSNKFASRGAVVVAGGKYLEPALVLALRLRQLGFPYTIQIWHMGPGEVWPSALPLLKELQVQTRDMLDYVDAEVLAPIPANVGLRRFQLKPLAILHSELEEVLLLDADNIPLEDPSSLFHDPRYNATGALFWPDYWTTHLDNPIWQVLGLEPKLEWEQESGQILIHKGKAWQALHLTVFLNSAFYMRLINGDKDTFRMAWKATGTPFHMVSTWPAAVGIERSFKQWQAQQRLCGHSMLQHAPDGRPLFLHHNQMKDLALPIGFNFQYVQYAQPHSRAVPSESFNMNGQAVSCLDFETPGLRFFDHVLPPVNHSHLEVFEYKYAAALRRVRAALRPDRVKQRMQRRQALASMGPTSGNSYWPPFSIAGTIDPTSTMTGLAFQVQHMGCSTNFTNAAGSGSSGSEPPCAMELASNCSSALGQMEIAQPSATSDRLCRNLSTSVAVVQLEVDLQSSGNISTGAQQSQRYAITWVNMSSGDRISLFPSPPLILTATLPYRFLTSAQVAGDFALIFTTSATGGSQATPIGAAEGVTPTSANTVTFQPSPQLINTMLYYQARVKEGMGGAITVVAPQWLSLDHVSLTGPDNNLNAVVSGGAQVFGSNNWLGSNSTVKLRFNTAFDPVAQLFVVQETLTGGATSSSSSTGPQGSSAFASTLAACQTQCMSNLAGQQGAGAVSSSGRTCLGVFIFRTSAAIKCVGLSDLGTPTPTMLESQSWVKTSVRVNPLQTA